MSDIFLIWRKKFPSWFFERSSLENRRSSLENRRSLIFDFVFRNEIYFPKNSEEVLWTSSFLVNCRLRFLCFENNFGGEINSEKSKSVENLSRRERMISVMQFSDARL